MRVLVEDRSFAAEYLSANDPGVRLIPVASERDALHQLAAGSADAAVVSQSGALYCISEARLNDLVPSLPVLPVNYSFAVPKGRADLLRTIDEGMLRIRKSGEYTRLYSKWLGPSAPGLSRGAPWWQVRAGALILLGLLGLTLVWTWSLRKQVSEKTRQLRAELEERARAEEQARKVIDTIPQQIWSIGAGDGSLEYCNRQWREYAGMELEEIQDSGWQKMLHPDERDSVLDAWAASFRTGAPYEHEERHRRADGVYRWFLCRALPLRDAEGRVERWYGSNTDIEDRKRAEVELERLNAELERRVAERTLALESANRELETFSYSVSHDLRAPLRALGGFAVLLAEEYGGQLSGEGRDLLFRIQAQAQKMSVLIDDLLRLSHTARQPLDRRTVNMGELAEECFAELALQRQGRDIEFEVKDLPEATGDRSLLRQAMLNLLDNAVKYTSGGDWNESNARIIGRKVFCRKGTIFDEDPHPAQSLKGVDALRASP